MLSDEQLMDTAATGSTMVGALRAVEVAVRADERKAQIEKDAALAATWAPSDWDGWLASETPYWVANAIRAQLEGTTDE